MRTRQLPAILLAVLLGIGGLSACSSAPAPKVRTPLTLSSNATSQAQQFTSQGTSAFQEGRYDEAKSIFKQAVSAAPQSGEAHYNLGLALFKLGDTEAAREQFIQAANLAPGNKVIWDSPALSPYSNPERNIQPKAFDPYDKSNRRPGGGFGGGRY